MGENTAAAAIEAMPEFQEVAEGLSDAERAVLLEECHKEFGHIMAASTAAADHGDPLAIFKIKKLGLPPHTPLNRFTLDLSYMDMKWSEGTKLVVRCGNNPPLIIDSPHRLLAVARKERTGGLKDIDTVELSADRGYLLWTNPRGSIEVKFKYGRSGEDFSCFIDPQHQGVKIWEVRGGVRKDLIVDGRQPIKTNTNPHHMTNSPVRHRQNIFEFRSRNGVVELQLETTRDYDIPAPKAFKFNYTLAL